MRKKTQGAAFKRPRDNLMGVTEDQDPGPGKTKIYCEHKVSKHGQKAASNAVPDYK